MNIREDIYEEAISFPRSCQGARRQNNEMTVRYLLEETYEENFLGRDLWKEIEREAGEILPGWEAKWNPI